MKIQLILVACFILFLFGCTEMSQSEKNLCYFLSSRSYDYIPTCTTEESCYDQVEVMFQTNLMYSQETKLYEIKNHIARSWFFYNNAVTEIKNISNLCKSGNIASLPGGINQMNFYLDNAFLELDQGMRQSFDIINFEEQFLSEEKIDRLKEEELYNSLIELRQILNELENGETNSNSYVSYYLEQVNNFNKNNNGNYSPIIEKTPFWLSTYYKIDKYLLEKVGLGKTGYFPALSNYFKQAISYLEFSFYKDESIKALQSFPVSQFMQLYSSLGGQNNSALARFIELMNKTSKNYSLLKNKHQELLDEVNKLKNETNKKYAQINQNQLNTFIKSKLLASKIIPKLSYQEQIIALTKNFVSLGERRAQGNLALGEDIEQLKLLKNDYLAIIKSIEENLLSENENLTKACGGLAQTILNNLKENQNTENEALKKYVSELTYLANKTISSKELNLSYCEKLILLDEEYQLGLENYKELESKKIDSTKNCFDYLEIIFTYKDFFEIQNIFNELKNTPVTEANLLFFEEACETLKKQVDNEISSEAIVKQITQKIYDTETLLDEIKINLTYFQDIAFEKEIEKTAKTFDLIKDSVYTNNCLDYSKLLPIKNEFEIKLTQIYDNARDLYVNKIIEFVQSHITISVIGDFVPRTGTAQQIEKRIIIDNPFREINKKITLNLSFNGDLISKDTAVEQSFENKLILTTLPKGKTKVDIRVSEFIEQIEKTEVILATNTNSIFQRTIEINAKTNYPKIIIQTTKPFGLYKTILFKNGFEQNYTENENEIIYANELKMDEKLVVYFYIEGLISTAFELTKTQQTNKNTIQTFKLIMKNMVDQELDATLTLPIKTNKTVESITLSNESNEKMKFVSINDEIVVKNEHFLSKQTKLYYLTLEIDDIFEYYRGELERVREQLMENGESEVSSEIKDFLLLAPGVNYLTDAQQLLKKATTKLDLIKKEKLSEVELLATKERLKNKIRELEEILAKATQLKLAEVNSIQELLKSAYLALDSNNEPEIFAILSNIEKFSFSISDKLKENAEKMWAELNKSKTLSDELDQLKNNFFNEKQTFDEIISFDPENGNAAYSNLEKAYSDFVNLEKELLSNQKEKETNLTTEINKLKENINELLTFLKSELSIDEKDLIKSKFIPPITQTRLQKISLELASIDSLSIKDQQIQLDNIFRELNSAADYLKSKTIKAYNLAIDNQFPAEQIKKAKTLIDNNKYLSAYFLLQENTLGNPSNYYYYFIPIILIVIIGLFLRYKISAQKDNSKSKQNKVEKEWD